MSTVTPTSGGSTLQSVSPRQRENRYRAPWTKALAAELRAELGRVDWTQKELAERADVPTVSVQRYMAGEVTVSIPALAALCDAFGVTVTDIVHRAEEHLG